MHASRIPWAVLLCLAGGIGMAVAQWFIAVYAPVEAVMGPIQKIFYIHLPFSWWGLISFFIVFLASIGFLVTRKPSFDRLASAAAEIGVLFATVCLITGMLWGRRSWGVWWTWDPRLSTALVMWFAYMGYLVLGHIGFSTQRSQLVRAVVGIVAFADVPLVFLSARMWRSIHPAVFASREGGLEPEMKITVLVCILAMGLLWAGLLAIRKQQLDQNAEADRLLFEREAAQDTLQETDND